MAEPLTKPSEAEIAKAKKAAEKSVALFGGDENRGIWIQAGAPAVRTGRVLLWALDRVAELERERALLRAVARDARAYAQSKHASYWQQTSHSLDALDAYDQEHNRV